MFHYLGSTLTRLKEKFSASDTEAAKHDNRSGLFLALALVVPPITIVATHIFLRSCTAKVFHLEGFQQGYGSGIFRYRILGRDLVLAVYHFLLRLTHGRDLPLQMPMDHQGTVLFYLSYIIVIGLFFFLSNLLLLVLLWDWEKGISDARLSQYFFLIFLWALSTANVTPYDQIAYFFMLLALISVRLRSAWLMYLMLGVSAIAGGLDRESQFLVTPALWTVALCTKSSQFRRYYRAGLFHLAVFSACYIALRIFISGPVSVSGIVTFGGPWAVPSLCVLVTLYCIYVSLSTREYPSKLPSVALAIMSAPYLITILVSGELHELRLLMPMLISLSFVYVALFRLRQEYQSSLDSSLPAKKLISLSVPGSPRQKILHVAR